MMRSRTQRARVRPPVDVVGELTDHLNRSWTPALRPCRRGRITGQGTGNKVQLIPDAEGGVADASEYTVLVAYTSTVVGAAGGPQENDDVLIFYPTPSSPIVLGRVAY